MKAPEPGEIHYFVDESGDPTFYDRDGNLIVGRPDCSPILILGFVETQNPGQLRRDILDLQRSIVSDPYFQGIPSLAKTAVVFHAKDDVAEIRYRVFNLLAALDFHAHFVIARKIGRVFRNSLHARETEFYDHLVTLLFGDVLHRYQTNRIYFSKRGSRDRQVPLHQAIQRGIARFEQKWQHPVTSSFSVQAQTPKGEP